METDDGNEEMEFVESTSKTRRSARRKKGGVFLPYNCLSFKEESPPATSRRQTRVSESAETSPQKRNLRSRR
jgi:hypothetical protein